MLFVDEGEVIECSLEEGGEERGDFGDDFFLEVLNEANQLGVFVFPETRGESGFFESKAVSEQVVEQGRRQSEHFLLVLQVVYIFELVRDELLPQRHQVLLQFLRVPV